MQSWEKVFVRGLVKFVTAVAYHFCLNLPATFSQPRTKTFSQLFRCMGLQNGKNTFMFNNSRSFSSAGTPAWTSWAAIWARRRAGTASRPTRSTTAATSASAGPSAHSGRKFNTTWYAIVSKLALNTSAIGYPDPVSCQHQCDSSDSTMFKVTT